MHQKVNLKLQKWNQKHVHVGQMQSWKWAENCQKWTWKNVSKNDLKLNKNNDGK